MTSQWTTGESKPSDFNEPRSLREAKIRIIELQKDISTMEAQLGDPVMKEGKTKTAFRDWRARVLKAKAWKVREYQLLQLWMEEEEARIREQLLIDEGEDDPNDPYCMLASMYRVTKEIIKNNNAQISAHQWRIIDQSRSLIGR